MSVAAFVMGGLVGFVALPLSACLVCTRRDRVTSDPLLSTNGSDDARVFPGTWVPRWGDLTADKFRRPGQLTEMTPIIPLSSWSRM